MMESSFDWRKLEGQMEVAKNLLDILGDDVSSRKTGLSIVEVKKVEEGIVE